MSIWDIGQGKISQQVMYESSISNRFRYHKYDVHRHNPIFIYLGLGTRCLK